MTLASRNTLGAVTRAPGALKLLVLYIIATIATLYSSFLSLNLYALNSQAWKLKNMGFTRILLRKIKHGVAFDIGRAKLKASYPNKL